jgi:hypothetical protein
MTIDREEKLRRAVFIVRLEDDDLGRLTGVVERVRTGAKARIDGLDGLGDVLAAMLAGDEEWRSASPSAGSRKRRTP